MKKQMKKGFTKPSRATCEQRLEQQVGLPIGKTSRLRNAVYCEQVKTATSERSERETDKKSRLNNLAFCFGGGVYCEAQSSKNVAFTLAEVLITLAIIGVVAALTIPTLISKISQKAKEARTEVIEKRLLDGLNRARTGEDILTQSYENTEEFLKKLGAYYKMSSICGAENIQDCLPEGTIHMKGDNDEITDIEVSELNTAAALGKNGDEWHAPAAFISAQGTPFIFILKKNCTDDPDKALTADAMNGHECFGYLYDNNGATGPNLLGTDIAQHGAQITTSGGDSGCLATVGGVCIKTAAFATSITKAQCLEEVAKGYGITQCNYESDYWAGAMKACHDAGFRLPNKDELTAMAQDLYDDTSITENYKNNLTLNSSKIPEDALSDFGSSWNFFWSYEEESATNAHIRIFQNFSVYSSGDRGAPVYKTVCVPY